MKCISLWQPWATLVAIEAKRWETRSWYMKHRGPLAIHAAMKKTQELRDLCRQEPFKSCLAAAGYRSFEELPFGAVVCTAEAHRSLECLFARSQGLINDQELAFGDYTAGRFCTELVKVTRLETPVPEKGRQGFWEWPWLAKPSERDRTLSLFDNHP